jgi:hypothetical protein
VVSPYHAGHGDAAALKHDGDDIRIKVPDARNPADGHFSLLDRTVSS